MGTADSRTRYASSRLTDEELRRALVAILGEDGVLTSEYDRRLYEYDASIDRAIPEAVVFPTSTGQIAELVCFCARERIAYTPRGAGTGLSGGAIAAQGGVLLAFSRMSRILEIDIPNRRAVVQLSQAVAPYGLQFAPDPSSGRASTIGGNVGENAGGPHTLMHGVTSNHVTGLEVVTPDGDIIQVGSKALDLPGYDLAGLYTGSEGTIGVVTAITVNLEPLPEAVKTLLSIFDSIDDASNSVSEIIGAGIVPAALEMMDRTALRAVEQATHAGYPLDAAAVLLIEVEGVTEEIDELVQLIVPICERNRSRDVRVARTAAERDLLWKGRKDAVGALGRLAPNFYLMDGVVPRSKLPEVMRRQEEIAARHGVLVANLFHAGDGNLHPTLLFDSDRPEERARAGGCGRDTQGLRRVGRDAHWRARYRRGEAAPGRPRMVSARPGSDGRCKARPRPDGTREPAEDDPHACPLRRDEEARAGRFEGRLVAVVTAVQLRPTGPGEAWGARHVATPASVEALARAIGSADEAGEAVILRGGGTQMGIGNLPRRADLVVDTVLLSEILEYSPQDLTITVQAGMRLRRLQEVLAERGQMLPLDPAVGPSATLRGILATAAAGPLRHRYRPRDLILGATVVRADGRVARVGGKVVKNVTGFDFSKLLVGSLGTLGVIAEVTLRLSPQQGTERTLVGAFPDATGALEVAHRLRHSPLRLAALAIEAGKDYRLAPLLSGCSPRGCRAQA